MAKTAPRPAPATTRELDRHWFLRDPEGYLRGLEAKLNQSALPL
jgi:hypothetical protein